MEYKGHTIDISVLPDRPGARLTFHATYTIRNGHGPILAAGTVAGCLHTVDAAERRAGKAACEWIDAHIT